MRRSPAPSTGAPSGSRRASLERAASRGFGFIASSLPRPLAPDFVRRVACLALALALSLAGCFGATRVAVAEDLEDEVRGYLEGYRWRRYDDAVARIVPERREAFLDRAEALEKELLIDDYEILRLKLRREAEAALVQVRYTWHLDSRGVVQETVVEQHWTRKGKHWFLLGEKRMRGDDMPAVLEPPSPKITSRGNGL